MKKKQYISPLSEATLIQASIFMTDTTSIELPIDMAPARREPAF
jgi:hypothetical protein